MNDRKYLLGIVADENAMFDLLAKFLDKEGYEVKRILPEVQDEEEFALMIYAPTRDAERSRKWFDTLRKKRPALLVVQLGDDDYESSEDNVVVLSERPLNLRQLSDTIKRTIEKSGYAEVNSTGAGA